MQRRGKNKLLTKGSDFLALRKAVNNLLSFCADLIQKRMACFSDYSITLAPYYHLFIYYQGFRSKNT